MLKVSKTKISLEEEKELVTKALKDPESFGKLYDFYFPVIFNYIYRRLLDFELANDISSEVFLKAYQKLWQFQWKSISIGAWLYRIASNEINLYFRQQKKYQTKSLDALRAATGFDVADSQNFLQEKLAVEEITTAHSHFLKIQIILKTLPTKYQEVIALRYFEQKSIKAISQILGKKEGTIKSLISRGMEKIRQAL